MPAAKCSQCHFYIPKPPPAPSSVPDWLKPVRDQAIGALKLKTGPKTKADPLDMEQLTDALSETFGQVVDAYTYEGLDVWFVTCEKLEHYAPDDIELFRWHIVLYEAMGQWECASITREV